MIIFDTLNELESYLPPIPALKYIITVMDRSLPYEKSMGDYACPEKDEIKYHVDTFLTSKEGFAFTVKEGSLALLVCLDGDEILSSTNREDVMVMSEGRFAILSEGVYHRGISTNLPTTIKDVLFTFPKDFKDDKGNSDTL